MEAEGRDPLAGAPLVAWVLQRPRYQRHTRKCGSIHDSRKSRPKIEIRLF
ncbi:MAG: hypothetical protein MUE85_09740 [Microscillaceae bacterium]|nr:hypothetical protein [Microscillaceae bacterium]